MDYNNQFNGMQNNNMQMPKQIRELRKNEIENILVENYCNSFGCRPTRITYVSEEELSTLSEFKHWCSFKGMVMLQKNTVTLYNNEGMSNVSYLVCSDCGTLFIGRSTIN